MRHILVWTLLGISTALGADAPWLDIFDGPAVSTGAFSFQIYADQGKKIVEISADGKVTFGPGYTPDTAARAFWEQISKLHPEMCAPK